MTRLRFDATRSWQRAFPFSVLRLIYVDHQLLPNLHWAALTHVLLISPHPPVKEKLRHELSDGRSKWTPLTMFIVSRRLTLGSPRTENCVDEAALMHQWTDEQKQCIELSSQMREHTKSNTHGLRVNGGMFLFRSSKSIMFMYNPFIIYV